MTKKIKKILIVDDEAGILEVIESVLTDKGYSVDKTTDSVEAIEMGLKNDYDLLITDLIMPKCNGIQVIGALKAIKPELLTILCSGNLMDEINKFNVSDEMISKPFDCDALSSIVEKVLLK